MPSEFRMRYPVADASIKAMLLGGGVAAVSALVSDMIEAKRQRDAKNMRDAKRTDEGTVVLHVGKRPSDDDEAVAGEKVAQSCGSGECSAPASADDSHSRVKTVKPAVDSREIRYYGEAGQPRTTDGRYSTLGKSAEGENPDYVSMQDLLIGGPNGTGTDFSWWQTPGKAIQMAAVPVAAVGGYHIVRAIHRKLEERRLKRQIDAAQHEYIDLLGKKSVKSAEAFRRMFLFDEEPEWSEKDAQAPQGQASTSVVDDLSNFAHRVAEVPGEVNDTAKTITAGSLAAMLLAGGASAWLTHKVLANYFDKKTEEDPRKVTRVVVKAGESKAGTPPFEHGLPRLMMKCADGEFEISPEEFVCTLEVLRDCIADSRPMSKSAAPVSDAVDRYNQLVRLSDIISGMPDVSRGMLGNFGFTPEMIESGAYKMTPRQLAEVAIAADESDPRYKMLKGMSMLGDPVSEIQKANSGYDPNRSFVDDIGNMPYLISGQEGGMTPELYQHALRRYGRDELGMKYEYDPSLDYRLAGAIGDTDPARIKDLLMQRMRDNPREWFGLIGSQQNADFRNALLQRRFQDMQNRGGFLGTLLKMPGVGDLMKRIASWYYNSTAMGRRSMMRNVLDAYGVKGDAQKRFMSNYHTPESGGWVEKFNARFDDQPQAAAGPATPATHETPGSPEASFDESPASFDTPQADAFSPSRSSGLRFGGGALPSRSAADDATVEMSGGQQNKTPGSLAVVR